MVVHTGFNRYRFPLLQAKLGWAIRKLPAKQPLSTRGGERHLMFRRVCSFENLPAVST